MGFELFSHLALFLGSAVLVPTAALHKPYVLGLSELTSRVLPDPCGPPLAGTWPATARNFCCTPPAVAP
eukprot:1148048-Pyramimonas_sp.AAC.1